MSHLSRGKLDLVNRTKKVIGQLESVLRALNEDEQCADVLQRLAAARGAINSLMGELLEADALISGAGDALKILMIAAQARTLFRPLCRRQPPLLFHLSTQTPVCLRPLWRCCLPLGFQVAVQNSVPLQAVSKVAK